MSTTELAALVTAATGLVSAIGGVIAVRRHVTGPAHAPAPPPAAAPASSTVKVIDPQPGRKEP